MLEKLNCFDANPGSITSAIVAVAISNKKKLKIQLKNNGYSYWREC